MTMEYNLPTGKTVDFNLGVNGVSSDNSGLMFPWEVPPGYISNDGCYKSIMKMEELIGVLRGIQAETGKDSAGIGLCITQIYWPVGAWGYYGDPREQRHVLCIEGIAHDKRTGEARILFAPSKTIFSVPANIFVNKLEDLASQGCHTVLLDTRTNAIAIKCVSHRVIIFKKENADNKDMHSWPTAKPKRWIRKPDDYFICKYSPIIDGIDIKRTVVAFSDLLGVGALFMPFYILILATGACEFSWGVFLPLFVVVILALWALALPSYEEPRPWK